MNGRGAQLRPTRPASAALLLAAALLSCGAREEHHAAAPEPSGHGVSFFESENLVVEESWLAVGSWLYRGADVWVRSASLENASVSVVVEPCGQGHVVYSVAFVFERNGAFVGVKDVELRRWTPGGVSTVPRSELTGSVRGRITYQGADHLLHCEFYVFGADEHGEPMCASGAFSTLLPPP